MGARKHGRQGDDIELTLPVGTQVLNNTGDGSLIADLTHPGQTILVAKGGRGGRGNARFATPTLQFPLLAEEGERGERAELRLELKLLADVGIIGAPNAGKSSLLAAVTAARPKVAAYPFTTLEPALGVVLHQDTEFVMVDIPGLIEGAHSGTGLGHDFLRHIERTRVLVHMVDGSDEDPGAQLAQVADELGLFSDNLLARPRIVAVNKIDIAEARERVAPLRRSLSGQGMRVHGVSAATREGVGALMNDVLQMLEETRSEKEAASDDIDERDVPVLRPKARRERVQVRKRGETYVVTAPAAARVAGMVDDADWNAMTQFYAHLRRLGVVKALEEAGVTPGDTVTIGKLELEWE